MDCRVLGVGVLLLMLGCFSEPGEDSSGGGTSTTDAGTGTSQPTTDPSGSETATSVADTSGSTGFGTTGFGTTGFETTGSSTGGCFDEQVGEAADIDIVMVIDASAAIADNAFEIQNMLDAFSDAFPRDLRHRFILMSPVEGADAAFCMPPPLGAVSCGESRFPYFTHLDVDTAGPGTDPLGVLTMQLNAGVESVRPGSQKHLVVVTDGDIVAMPANAVNAIRDLGPEFANIRIHSVSGGGQGCSPSPALEAAAGMSFGTSIELCPLAAGAELFTELLAPLPSCVFNIPDIDPDDITGATLSAGDMDVPLAEVDSIEDCGGEVAGATITPIDGVQSLVLCPGVCAMYQDQAARTGGGLTVSLCE